MTASLFICARFGERGGKSISVRLRKNLQIRPRHSMLKTRAGVRGAKRRAPFEAARGCGANGRGGDRMKWERGREPDMRQYETTRLVAQADLNHHGTLFAARAAGWFVEAAFAAVGRVCGTTEGIVCRSLHEMSFRKPVGPGTLLCFRARAVYAGTSSLMIAVAAVDALTEQTYITGTLTFVTVDGQGRGRAHGIALDQAADETERGQRAEAERLRASLFSQS